MITSFLALLAYSTLTLAQAQHWKSESTAESWATSSTTALPLPVPTRCSFNSSSGGDSYTSGLIAALNANNFTVLAGIAAGSGGAIFGLLQGGNKTLFAPSDSALNSLASTASSLGFTLDSTDPATLNALLSYHIVPRPIDPAGMFEGEPSIVETQLTDPRWVQLPNGAPQVLVLLPTSPPSDQFVVQRLLSNTTTISSFPYENLDIRRIDSVLIPPPSLSTVLGVPTPEVNLTSFDNAQPSELSSLVNSTGVTLFAPWNGAISNALESGELTNLTRGQVVNIIANHFTAPGTVLYSTNISDGATSTSDTSEQLSFINNSTGRYVSSGDSTARIIRENVIVSNGNVFVIEELLINTDGIISGVPSATSTTSPTGSATTVVAATSSAPTSVSDSSLASSPTETSTETGTSIPSSATSIVGSLTSEAGSVLPTRKIRRSRLAPLVV